jgi:hypothetical protein
MKKLPEKLKSRKFWIAVLTSITLILSKQYNEAVAVIIAYLTVEGTADAVKSYKNPMGIQPNSEIHMSQNIDDATLVTGTGKVRRFDEADPEE